MPFVYTNRRGKKYFLHTGPKKGGGTQHFFSQKASGTLAKSVPSGFEVYETPNGQVYLRRQQPALITEAEVDCVKNHLARRKNQDNYQVEVRGKHLVIHEASQGMTDAAFWQRINPMLSREQFEETVLRFAHFTPVMRFELVDEAKRIFGPERYCFRGSVDDWIPIGGVGSVEELAKKYLKHLGQESIYELY